MGLPAAIAFLLALGGCLRISPEPPRAPVTSAPRPPAPPPAPRSQAYGAFEQWRADLLKQYPGLGGANAAFVFGVDVSQSAQASLVLEYTTKLLGDACRYFLAPGDKVVIVPWDSRVREQHVKSFEVAEGQQALDDLDAAFENLENLVEPESRGSNLLDARGYCMEKALGLQEQSAGGLVGVVVIFTDIRVPDFDLKQQTYAADKLKRLRSKLTGSDSAEFFVRPYQAGEKTQIIAHNLVGKLEGVASAAGLNRDRSAPVQAQRAAMPPPVAPPPDMSGLRSGLLVLGILAFVALCALPFACRLKLQIGDVRESIPAFGGAFRARIGQGVSPRGQVFVHVPGGTDGQELVTLRARGFQVVAEAGYGVRLNDGAAEREIPLGKPDTIRMTIGGVPGEQTLEVSVAEFFATNAGPIVGMGVALIVLLACIIG